MKKTISVTIITIASVCIFTTLFFSLLVSYDMLKSQVVDEIRSEARMLAHLELSDDWSFIEYVNEDLRVTVVDLTGEVLYDNAVDADTLDNHGDREEIVSAIETGEGQSIRRSSTLSSDLFYYAVRSDYGYVVRVAREASSVQGIIFKMLPPIGIVVIVLIIISIFIAKTTTRRIVEPIENVATHLDDIDSVVIYDEIAPFIDMIQKQHEDIIKNATMRQDFTANVSHELKTPLTSISGYAELIESGLADSDNVNQFARSIHQNADRLLTLINDIIRLSQLDAISGDSDTEFEDINIKELAINCRQLLEMSAKNHDVTMEVEGDDEIVHGNRQMLDELIYNLCDNAIRYNKPKGRVKIYIFQDTDGVCLSVGDTGIGIPKESRDRVFERFYRVDKSRSRATGGTGLGLAIVKHIAQIHGAKLELNSELGTGTNIKVIFPKM